jgi:phage-related protein
MKRSFIYWGDYFEDFIDGLEEEVQEKIFWILRLVESTDRIPAKFFKQITGVKGLYEIRIEWTGNIYRIFCFFEPGNIIVLCNGFVKKTPKTPNEEITRAQKIRTLYYEAKKK